MRLLLPDNAIKRKEKSMKTLKYLLFTSFLSLLFTFLSAFSVSAEDAKFTYYKDTDTGTLCISGIIGDKAPENVVFPTEIGGVKVGKIQNMVIVNDNGDGQYKPFDLKGARHIVIPEGYTKICEFTGTENLETVKLPKSIKVLPSFCFAGADKLYSINLEYLTSVSSFAFSGCTSLREVNLINASKVGTKAFENTVNLTIYAMENSASHKYAEDNGISFSRLSGFEKKAIKLCDLGLMKGTGITEYGRRLFDLDRTPTRAEAVTMLVRFLGKEKDASETPQKHPFSDVPQWADGYVSYAYTNGLTKGMSDTEFGSDMLCTPEMYLTFMLRVLGYSDVGDNADFSYENPWEFAQNKGITPRFMNTSPFYRSEMVDMSYLTLTAKLKGTDMPLYMSMISQGIFTLEEYEYWVE